MDPNGQKLQVEIACSKPWYFLLSLQSTSFSYLVGGLEHEFYFPFHIWDVILPIDELIFFKMVIALPTSYVFLVYSMTVPVHDAGLRNYCTRLDLSPEVSH